MLCNTDPPLWLILSATEYVFLSSLLSISFFLEAVIVTSILVSVSSFCPSSMIGISEIQKDFLQKQAGSE
jgi:hypothetical protein